jgi:hypothetical protein
MTGSAFGMVVGFLIDMVGSAFRMVGQAFRWSGWLSIGMVGLLFGMVSNNQVSVWNGQHFPALVSIYHHQLGNPCDRL